MTYEKILASTMDIFTSYYILNLKDDTVEGLKTNKFIEMWSENENGVQNKLNNVMKNITREDYIDKILEFVDISTLEQRIVDSKMITTVFPGKINGWSRARLIEVDRDEQGHILHAIYAVECINEEKEKEIYLQYLAQTDQMTGIYNRGQGEANIIKLLNNKQPGLFCLFDVDCFKRFNDKYGHDVGDQVLIQIANCLKEIKKNNDIVMRLGGDEFAIYFVDVTEKETAIERIRTFFKKIDQIYIPTARDETISISLGAAFYKDGIDFDEIYKAADQGVYSSKNNKGSSLTISI